MGRFLMIDIGAGTLDLLLYDTASGEHFKAVTPSPVRQVGAEIERTSGPLAVDGVEMGGGQVTVALQRRAQSAEVVMTPAAAATLHHDADRVRRLGVLLATETEVARLAAGPTHGAVTLGDIRPGRIARIIEGIGFPMEFDAVAICAQDHGDAPAGTSHLDFRHNRFREMLDPSPRPHGLLFRADEVPPAFSRLGAIVQGAGSLNAEEVYVMDSGMAAMVGASLDSHARGEGPVMILDVATSHTVVAVMEGEQVAGFVEYHTRDITLDRLEKLMRELADGRVRHQDILAEGGHGAYLRHGVGFENLRAIIVTGPKRGLLRASRLPLSWGAPWGDNMMTGTVGLLEALRRRKGLPAIDYL